LNKGENIVKYINGQRIKWLSHLERMEEDGMHKNIFTQELEGTRRGGRSRNRWREKVERNFQVLEVRRWRELVIDKDKWRGIVRQDKAPSGLYRQRKEKKNILDTATYNLKQSKVVGFFLLRPKKYRNVFSPY
jgi:hypothetical protein